MVGIDEVGRGPLAGPVTVCACAVSPSFDFTRFKDIRDSKKLTSKKRDMWFKIISDLKDAGEIRFACTSISAQEIDSIGIVPAIQKALDTSLQTLSLTPETTEVFLDGSLHAPDTYPHQETIIKGDEKVPLISAASIIAKVIRDRYMDEQGKLYPVYGFEKHKGYGTAFHIQALKKEGLTALHRRSFLSFL